MRVMLRGIPWIVRERVSLGARTRFRLEDPDSGETIEALCPPDEFAPLVEPAPSLDRGSLTPFGIWPSLHDALRLQSPNGGRYAAFHAGRISPEPYQFAPLVRLLAGPRRSLLIADDVGLGKTVFDLVITSTEYLERRGIHASALTYPWDAIVVDEAHYLAESGTPANPYSTARTRLGPQIARCLSLADFAHRHAA